MYVAKVTIRPRLLLSRLCFLVAEEEGLLLLTFSVARDGQEVNENPLIQGEFKASGKLKPGERAMPIYRTAKAGFPLRAWGEETGEVFQE